MSDTVGFYGKMTVYKNLQFFAKYHNVSLDKLDAMLKELELFEDKDKKAENYQLVWNSVCFLFGQFCIILKFFFRWTYIGFGPCFIK